MAHYFIFNAESEAAAFAIFLAAGWAYTEEGQVYISAPTWCDLIPSQGYISQAVYDIDPVTGEITEGAPAVLVPGAWFIGHVGIGETPEVFGPYVVAFADADTPMTLPVGVHSVMPILANMPLPVVA